MIILIHIGKQSGDITTHFKRQIHKKEHPCQAFLLNKLFMVKIQAMSSFDLDTSFFLDQPYRNLKNGMVYLTYKKKTLALAK